MVEEAETTTEAAVEVAAAAAEVTKVVITVLGKPSQMS